jgi:importin-5
MELVQTEPIHVSQVVPAWLSCLPIKDDKVEAKVVHGQLCSMVER